jgi:hypothetical protein
VPCATRTGKGIQAAAAVQLSRIVEPGIEEADTSLEALAADLRKWQGGDPDAQRVCHPEPDDD